jgi:hypothetical protein
MSQEFLMVQCRELMGTKGIELPSMAERTEIAEKRLGQILVGAVDATEQESAALAGALGQNLPRWQFQVFTLPSLNQIRAGTPPEVWRQFITLEHSLLVAAGTRQAIPAVNGAAQPNARPVATTTARPTGTPATAKAATARPPRHRPSRAKTPQATATAAAAS